MSSRDYLAIPSAHAVKVMLIWFCIWMSMVGIVIIFLVSSIGDTSTAQRNVWEEGRLEFEKNIGTFNFIDYANLGPKDFRVVWMAPFYSYSGYGTEAISFVMGLSKLLPGQLIISHFGDNIQKGIDREFPDEVRLTLKKMKATPQEITKQYPIVSVCHSTPPLWGKMCPLPRSAVKIGRTMFETNLVPSQWVRKINLMDQVWVPTKFHIETFVRAGIYRRKLVAIPEAVNTDFFDPSCYLRTRQGIFSDFGDDFVFVSIFKWEERKGWKTLIRAYFEEFKQTDRVQLLVVTRKTQEDQEPLKEIEKLRFELSTEGFASHALPKMVLHTDRIDENELPLLYKNADAFVLASKGEGWSRPLVEAMCMELPTIHTFWSGPTEFMTHENSYPLNITGLVPVDESAGPGTKGHMWAEPSKEHLRTLLRHVFESPEENRKKGQQARLEMVEKYSIPVVARLVESKISEAAQAFIKRMAKMKNSPLDMLRFQDPE